MDTVNFWTAVSYGDQEASFIQQLLEKVDDYFYLGGKKAIVIPEEFRQGQPCAFLLDVDVTLLSTALKVASYLTIILPIVMLAVKAVMHTYFTFYLTDARQLLEEGIEITPAIIQTIQRLMPKILFRQWDSDIHYCDNYGSATFSLTAFPTLRFTKASSPAAQEHLAQIFNNKIDGKRTCLIHHLSQLVIPHSKLFNVAADGQSHSFIAEEYPAYRQNNESIQEQLYYEFAHDLELSLHQFVTFIAKTRGYALRSRPPVIDTAPSHLGSRRIALLHFDFQPIALDQSDFVRFLPSERSIDDAIALATRYEVPSVRPSGQLKSERLAEIAKDQQLLAFHAQNGLLQNPYAPLVIDDLQILGLDLNAKGTLETYARGEGKEKIEVTVREVAEDVIAAINQAITDNFDRGITGSSKATRRLVINTTKPPRPNSTQLPLCNYDMLGNPIHVEQRWIFLILEALKERQKIFNFNLYTGQIVIQA